MKFTKAGLDTGTRIFPWKTIGATVLVVTFILALFILPIFADPPAQRMKACSEISQHYAYGKPPFCP